MSGYIPLENFTISVSARAPGDEAGAAASTVDAVRSFCSTHAQKQLKLDASSFVLICDSPSGSNNENGRDEAELQLVKDIADAARAAAPAHACSSVLAGHASESDEYADVGLWITSSAVDIDHSEGSLEKNARAVLSALGLDCLLSLEVVPLFISKETNVPVAFKASAQDADVQRLTSLLARLSNLFAFSVSIDSMVVHCLLGKVPGGNAWAGLLGVGTWSD